MGTVMTMNSGANTADVVDERGASPGLPISLPHAASSATLSLPDGSDSESDDAYNSFTELEDAIENNDEEGWIDAAVDSDDEVRFMSFFDDKEFPDLSSMLGYVKSKYGFDYLRVCYLLRKNL